MREHTAGRAYADDDTVNFPLTFPSCISSACMGECSEPAGSRAPVLDMVVK